MDLSNYLPVAFLGGIIVLLQIIKYSDTKKKLSKGFYIRAAFIFGLLGGFLSVPFSTPLVLWIQKALFAGVGIGGGASLLYQNGKLIIFPQINNVKQNDTTDNTTTDEGAK